MKRIFAATAALALMTGAVIAQTTTQPADTEESQRKGAINQPSGAGSTAGGGTAMPADAGAANPSSSNKGANSGTGIQPADPEQAQKRGGVAQPSGAGGTTTK